MQHYSGSLGGIECLLVRRAHPFASVEGMLEFCSCADGPVSVASYLQGGPCLSQTNSDCMAHVIFGLLLCALDFSIRAIIKSGSMALARSTGTHPCDSLLV